MVALNWNKKIIIILYDMFRDPFPFKTGIRKRQSFLCRRFMLYFIANLSMPFLNFYAFGSHSVHRLDRHVRYTNYDSLQSAMINFWKPIRLWWNIDVRQLVNWVDPKAMTIATYVHRYFIGNIDNGHDSSVENRNWNTFIVTQS